MLTLQVSPKQVYMVQLFSFHCYAALYLFQAVKLQSLNLTLM